MRNYIFFIGLFFLMGCNLKDKSDCTCAEFFRTITFKIQNKNFTPTILTSYKVTRLSDKKDFTIDSAYSHLDPGVYPITNDNYFNYFKDQPSTLEFEGYINDSLVVKEQFIITIIDCCHVDLERGPGLVTLN